jgi:hypothetical protein
LRSGARSCEFDPVMITLSALAISPMSHDHNQPPVSRLVADRIH